MDEHRGAMLSKRSFLITLSIVLLVQLPISARSAPSEQSVTMSPYPIATSNPVPRRPPMTRYSEKDYYDDEEISHPHTGSFPTLKEPYFSPPQLLLTLMRTLTDVLKIVNQKKSEFLARNSTKLNRRIIRNNTRIGAGSRIGQKITLNQTVIRQSSNESSQHSGRGLDPGVVYEDLPDYHHDHDDTPPPPPPTPVAVTEGSTEVMKQSRYSDPWDGYYEFIITEGSFKFWSAFQLATAALLLYSALAAIYYAKFNPIQPDYDTTYDDYFFGRSLEDSAPALAGDSAGPAPGWLSALKYMGSAAYQRIMDAIHRGEEQFS